MLPICSRSIVTTRRLDRAVGGVDLWLKSDGLSDRPIRRAVDMLIATSVAPVSIMPST